MNGQHVTSRTGRSRCKGVCLQVSMKVQLFTQKDNLSWRSLHECMLRSAQTTTFFHICPGVDVYSRWMMTDELRL